MNIDKIIITGDMLRPSNDGSGNNQIININWLYHLLRFPLAHSTPVNTEVLNWENKNNAFDSKKFYTLNNQQSMPEDWIKLYHSKNYSKASLEYMHKYFENSLVIGFELPDIFIAMFDELNITYIDFIIHPVRYLDDILFGIRTNNEKIFIKLKQHYLHSQVFSIYAGIHTATVNRMPKKIRLEKGSALFTGQVEVDKSLIKEGEILSLLDFQHEFTEITKRYKKVYFKKHPYAEGNYQVDYFLRRFKNVEFIDENFYYLLGQEEIEAVYSISSSTVLEAKYWGKESDYFHKNPFTILLDDDQNFNSSAYITIYEKFLLPSFWSDVLSDVIETRSIPHIELPSKPNRLRNSLQNYWGYNFLDIDILLKHATNLNHTLESNTKGMSVVDLLKHLEPEIENKRRELENKKRGLENKRRELENKRRELENKRRELENKRRELENKRRALELIGISKQKKAKKPTLYQQYQNSHWKKKVQRIKYIPYIGPSLLYIKHKILKR